MTDYKQFFRGKKITVMGLGLLGRGLGVTQFLAECGAELIVTDLKSEAELTPSLEKLKKYSDIKYTLGKHELEDFKNRDMIIRAPNAPLDSIYLAEARKEGIPVEMDASLFAKLFPAIIIGVTGTRGKTTTSHLIYTILKAAGKKVLLGGNIQGMATLSLLPEATSEHIVVLELDSWQLQGFGEAKMSPNIAVFTNFYPDHLNYYKNDMDAYLADKANIFLYQKDGDALVLGSQVVPMVNQKYSERKGRQLVADKSEVADWKLTIPGDHNLENAACAAKVGQVLGIDEGVIKAAIESFVGVPGRLEFVREVNGVKIFNDTTATTPEATIAGLRALSGEGRIILITGGTDKNLSMGVLCKEINERASLVVLLSGTGTEKIKNDISVTHVLVTSLGDAVKEAIGFAKEGDIILFSPAFASFGMFKNEYDRGEQFVSLVKKL